MLWFYHGSGSGELIVLGEKFSGDEWARLQNTVIRLLRGRSHEFAADLLNVYPFRICNGTNGFNDEFSVLYLLADFDDYMDLADKVDDANYKSAFRIIANTITEIGPYIRFVAVELNSDSENLPVSAPVLEITSESVERALADAEHLISSRGATSGVDRVHTALHAYLRTVANKAGIIVASDADVTVLFKAIREQHPSFTQIGPRSEDIKHILRSLAATVDVLNPIRNRASGAHPNENVLDEPEAMLVINAIRTLLHYLNSKIK
jgi:hypothetical protein